MQKKIIFSTVLLIGVGCMGVGIGSVSSYFIHGHSSFSIWMGSVPMAFSTSVVTFFIGAALYLIGKYHLTYDKTIR